MTDQALHTKEVNPYLVLCLVTTLLNVLWRFVDAAGNGFFTAILQNKTAKWNLITFDALIVKINILINNNYKATTYLLQ